MRDQTAKYILEKNKSATQTAEEMGIDTNILGKWVRDYRRKNNLPSYAEARGIKRAEPQTQNEFVYRVKELEREAKKREKPIVQIQNISYGDYKYNRA